MGALDTAQDYTLLPHAVKEINFSVQYVKIATMHLYKKPEDFSSQKLRFIIIFKEQKK